MRVELTSHARRQLKGLRRQTELAERIREALQKTGSDPCLGKELEANLAKVYTYRVGSWRILYEVHQDRLLVLVLEIADRKEVYR